MYKCKKCGAIFESPKTREEDCGEYWGGPCHRLIGACPECGYADYDEVEKCKICGSYYLRGELHSGICGKCIDMYRKDFDTCYKLAKTTSAEITINQLLATLFSAADIECILVDYINRYFGGIIDCSNYIDDDIEWFADGLAREKRSKEGI